MSKRLIVAAALVMVAACAALPARGQAAEEFANSAEGKVLARYVGKWASEVEITGAEPKKGTDTSEGKWTLKGRYVDYKVDSKLDDSEALHLLTYDAEQKVYRSWWFSSTGQNNTSTGTWDEATKKFSWKGEPKNGLTAIWVDHFTDDDTRVGELVVTDGDGKVVYGIKWKAVRKK